MKILPLAALLTTLTLSANAAPRHSYAQGACDGIRATEHFESKLKIAVVIVKAKGKNEYLSCNGDSEEPAQITLFVRQTQE